MKYLNKTITVDPGWNTGIAYWIGDNKPLTHIIKEPAKRKKIKIEEPRLIFMMSKFKAHVQTLSVKDCYIEGVEMWSGSTKSITAAQRGDTFGLAYLVGGFIEICHQLEIKPKIVYPRGGKGKLGWKGQLGPEAIAKRLYRINQIKYPEHIREAVAIGFSITGEL